jgi:hypothetical protein
MADRRRLDVLLDEYASRRVREMPVREIMQQLEEQGIGSLEDLVMRSLEDLEAQGEVSNTFVYKHAVYKNDAQVPNELLDVVEANIEHL